MATHDPLEGLNPPQREVVLHEGSPLLVLAGAGSGKTRALTHRIAHLVGARGVAPGSILAVTFTNKAAGEIRERLRGLLGESGRGIRAGTFHSICVRLLRAYGDRIGLTREFTIYDEADRSQVLKALVREANLGDDTFHPNRLVHAMGVLKSRGIDPRDSDAEVPGTAGERKLELLREYQERLTQAGALDFDDLLLVTVRMLRQNEALTDYLRTGPFHHLLIDEFQDTNSVQHQFVRLVAGGGDRLMAVGDEDQSIYGWRGADVSHILRFERDFPRTRVIKLEQNYRSTGNILKAAHSIIAADKTRRDKTLWTDGSQGEPVLLRATPTDLDEARFVVSEILRLARVENRRPRDFAIFYRTNAQSRAIEDELRRWNLPYIIVGGTRFYDRAEIKDALCYLRAALSPGEPVALRRILNRPARGIGATTLERVDAIAREHRVSWPEALGIATQRPEITPSSRKSLDKFLVWLREVQATAGDVHPVALLERLLGESGYLAALEKDDDPEAQGRRENLDELIRVAGEFETREPEGTARQFLDEVSLVADSDDVDEQRDRVNMMTLHTAKGLEFPVVFLVGLEEQLLPHVRSMNLPLALAEERRLLYVGMTRARERLAISYADARVLHGERRPSVPSRFLADLDRECAKFVGVTSLGSGQYHRPAAPAAPSIQRSAFVPPASKGPSQERAIDRETSQEAVRKLLPTDEMKPGMVVFHPTFGRGTIRGSSDYGESKKVLVQFSTVGLKKLLVKQANLGVFAD
ncbi:MAG: UvrD-helicase domain-containing protein [Deltaproteobacteria bacterium]|nr:UvrD-helicase domain-containing protein [Deltaproteobacteria bacterium]